MELGLQQRYRKIDFLIIFFPRLITILLAIMSYYNFLVLWRCDPTRVMASSFLRFLHYTQQRTTVGRTPLDE